MRKRSGTVDRSWISQPLSETDCGLVATFHPGGGLHTLGVCVGGRIIGSRLALESGVAAGRGTFPCHLDEDNGDSEVYRDGSMHSFNPWSDNSRGEPLHFAVWAKRWIDTIEAEARSLDQDEPLFVAARSGTAADVRRAVERDGEVDPTDGLGRTPLMWAAAAGNLDAIETLLDLGANPNLLSQRRNPFDSNKPVNDATALTLAAKHRQPRVVAALLAGGARADLRVHRGYTALHWATAQDCKASVGHLLSAESRQRIL